MALAQSLELCKGLAESHRETANRESCFTLHGVRLASIRGTNLSKELDLTNLLIYSTLSLRSPILNPSPREGLHCSAVVQRSETIRRVSFSTSSAHRIKNKNRLWNYCATSGRENYKHIYAMA